MKATTSEKKTCLQVEDASISYALQKKSTRKSVHESNRTNIVFSAKTVMKTILATFSASFANKFTQSTARMKTTTSG
jgi:hypothetical protein